METQYKDPINKSFKIESRRIEGRRYTHITDLTTGEELPARSIKIHFEDGFANLEVEYYDSPVPLVNETGMDAVSYTLRGSVEGEFSFESRDVAVVKWV